MSFDFNNRCNFTLIKSKDSGKVGFTLNNKMVLKPDAIGNALINDSEYWIYAINSKDDNNKACIKLFITCNGEVYQGTLFKSKMQGATTENKTDLYGSFHLKSQSKRIADRVKLFATIRDGVIYSYIEQEKLHLL